MDENAVFYNDEQFEQLVRYFDKRKDRGVRGLIDRITSILEAHENLEPERFDRFCQRNYIRSNIEKDMLLHFGKRLEALSSILRGQLGPYCVLQILLLNRDEFDKVVRLAAHCRDPDARSLFRDLVDALVSKLNKLKPGDPDMDIWGMNWKTDLMPREPILDAHESVE